MQKTDHNMKILLLIASSLAASLFANLASAEIYSCSDASGRIITSDRPIPECAERAMTVRKNNGQNPREIPRPMTAEEKKKFLLEQEKKKNEEMQEEQRKKDELYLLANYKSENDIEVMRKRSVEVLLEKIRIGNEQMQVINQLLATLQAEQQSPQKKSDAEHADLRYRANQLALSIKNSKLLNEKYEAEVIRLNAQFDETLKNYREVIKNRKK